MMIVRLQAFPKNSDPFFLPTVAGNGLQPHLVSHNYRNIMKYFILYIGSLGGSEVLPAKSYVAEG